jgi:LacI family transcriptional regulator
MDTPRRITLADVALKAGVHVTTVSLAIRNNPRIPDATRERIRALATEMGYAPDPMLRALVSYRSRNMKRRNSPTIAYVTNWKTKWGWKTITAHPEFYAGAESKATELGFKLDHFWLGEPGLTHTRISSIFRARGISGLILASHGFALGDALQLDWRRFSAIKIDYYPHKPLLHNVTNNQCDIARLAMQRVMAMGYRRIGFVMHRGWDHAADHYWTAGFLGEQQNLEEHERIPAYIFPGMQPVAGWFNEYGMPGVVDPEDFRRWFERYRPEVILSKDEFVASALKTLGLRVPRDVAYVDLFLEKTTGGTAGVRQNHRTVGELAVELLAGQLQHNKYGIPEIPTTTFVEGTWFDGATCPPKKPAAVAS